MPHTSFFTTISRVPTKQHIILPYRKYLHLTRVGGAPIWFLVHIKLKNSATHLIFNYNITRPYQTTYYFALHKIFTSYTSLRRGPYLVPGLYHAKNSATHLIFSLQYHETRPNNILFCSTQNIYILHEFKKGPLFGSWSISS